jgi:NAD(P)-dependent dehydrogenase (short-subunit alcohol dehydrogenase family)
VSALTLYVATSHGKQGIRANTIVPGLIIIEAVRAHIPEDLRARFPQDRVADPTHEAGTTDQSSTFG